MYVSKYVWMYVCGMSTCTFNLSFPKEVENPSLSLLFSSLVCIHLGYLLTDISGIDQDSSFHLAHILLSFTVISFAPILMLFDL